MDLLRLITAGSVDDGKSTLIGRLLFDSKSIMIDQLEAIGKQSRNKENGELDLALLTDGLRAEREQGITIDVAYKYFSTPRRKFILADTPGHIQYTRNMVTGASNADLAIVLVDARKGVIEQTKRHSIIASILGIKHVVVAVNKMDLVNFAQDTFSNIVVEYSRVAVSLGLSNIKYIPISALLGDNIVAKSQRMSWYEGETLLDFLETVNVDTHINLKGTRLPVQYVIRPQTEEFHDYRGYAGKIASGSLEVGDVVTIFPAGIRSKVVAIETGGFSTAKAFAPQSVVVRLEDNIDISRGDLIISGSLEPEITQELNVLLCWMDAKSLKPENKYFLQMNSRLVKSVLKEVEFKLDVNTLEKLQSPENVGLNDIVQVKIRTASPVAVDKYNVCKTTGSGILIDETSHATVAACLIQ
ncbi:sulfate adenylyltransferase subunit 1 [Cytophagales bacterium WSM2-2]|nr:sulfate adenylyltransferase subunit 1 [Cytophagales bacterium WSM2-2]